MLLRILYFAFAALIVLHTSLNAQVAWEPANHGLEGGRASANTWTFNEDGDIYALIGSGLYRLDKGIESWTLLHDTMASWSLIAGHDGVLLSASREILRSEDKGATWQSVFTANEDISSFRMAPDGAIWGVSHTGLYRSEDNGQTWTASAVSDSMMGFKLVFDKQGRALATGWGGVFRSEDDGTTWKKIASTITYSLNSVVVTSSGDLLAASSNCYRRSTDDGVTWTVVDSLPVVRLAVAPNGNIYAGVINRYQDYPGATNHSGIYRSTDDGTTWTYLISLRPAFLTAGPDGDIWVSAGNRILRSTDNGEYWHEVIDNLWAMNVLNIKSDRFGTLYATIDHDTWISDDISAGTYYALYGSTDNGDSWSLLRDSLCLPDIRFDSSDGLYVITDAIFVQDGKLQRSTDRGQSWSEFPNSSGNDAIGSNRNGVIAISFYNVDAKEGGMMVSTDGGVTWTRNVLTLYAYSIIVSLDNTILIAGVEINDPTASWGLYRSTNYSRDWDQIRDKPYTDLSISPAGDIYLTGPYSQGSDSRNLYRINSDMTEWTLLIDSTELGFLKFGGRDVLFLRGDTVGYRSTNRGEHWEPLSVSGTLVEVATTSNQQEIYMLTMDSSYRRNIHRSTDNGVTWLYQDAGISNRLPSMITASGDQIFAATYGSGVYRTARPAGVPVSTRQESVELTLGQNTPNPFNSTTTIPFVLPHQQHVTVKVHDLLGREVAILADGVIPGGEYTVQFKASGMASGVYVVTLTGEIGSQSRLMVVQ